MKTKLLKKIRKEYSIYRIDDAGDCEGYKNVGIDIGYPFYHVDGIDDLNLTWSDECFKSKNEAVSFLIKRIIRKYDNNRYQRKFVKPVVEEKVYYVK